MAHTIEKITAEEILDSRGNPTLSVTVTAGDKRGTFGVPSGASTGAHEAHELRDGDMKHYGGSGVKKVVEIVEDIIAPALHGIAIADQKKIDTVMLELDGTPNKTKLGGNAMVGVSVACAKAAGGENLIEHLQTLADIPASRPQPLLFMNLINGGKHAGTRLAFQEYHVVPMVDTVEEALEIGVMLQRKLHTLLAEKVGRSAIGYGDEGGFVPDVEDVRLPLELLTDAISQTGNEDRVRLSLDVAASSFYTDGKYAVGDDVMSAEQLFDMYVAMQKDFNFFSIEDPFDEEDFDNFAKLLAAGGGMHIVGDDLTVTNVSHLTRAIKEKSIDTILIKPNQVGTLTETLDTMALARKNNMHCLISHRSGETNDAFIADLAVAFGCHGIKAGAPQRGERVAKYNRLAHLFA